MRRKWWAWLLWIPIGLTACGDDDDFDQPDSVDVGEQQRQTCVDSGKIVIVSDRNVVIGCVSIEQYQAILKNTPPPVEATP
jgi:hypothetical protein